MGALDGIVSEVTEALLGMGLRGIVTALVLLFAWVLVRKGVAALPAPTDPGPTPKMPDVADVPDADSSWQTDPDHPGGDNVGGA